MERWITLNSLPPEGLPLTLDDPAIWDEPLREFGVLCTILAPLKADVFLLAQNDGCFVRGRITGRVSLPCDRCAEDVPLDIDQRFETFETAPGQHDPDEAEADGDVDDHVIRNGESGVEINMAALLWEEFSLALPVHPLCRTNCAGLCPLCGQNLNEAACACTREQGDPRLAALRGLTLKKTHSAPE